MRVMELIQYHFEQNKEFLKDNDYRKKKNFKLYLFFMFTNVLLTSILIFNSKIESLLSLKINQGLNMFIILLNLVVLILIGKKIDKQMVDYFKDRKINLINQYPTYLREIHQITFSNELNHLIGLLKEHNSHNYSLKNINFAVFSLMVSIISLTISVVPLSLKLDWYFYLLAIFIFILFIKFFLQQKYNFRTFPKRKRINELISILEEIQLSFLINENRKSNEYFISKNLYSKNHRIRRKNIKK